MIKPTEKILNTRERVRLKFSYLPGADLVIDSLKIPPSERGSIEHRYWQTHPRINFMLRTAPDGRLLDMGCGSGGLAFARDMYEPRRPDIKMYGCELAAGKYHHLYEKVVLGDYNKIALDLEPQSIDAILASHFFEHIENVEKFFKECFGVLRPGGQIYIEIPAPHAAALPHAKVLQEQGLPAYASSFYEDDTHHKTYAFEELGSLAAQYGFELMTQGYITNPHIENELLYLGYTMKDADCSLYGLWSKTKWALYVILQKPTELQVKIAQAPVNLSREASKAVWTDPEKLGALYKFKAAS